LTLALFEIGNLLTGRLEKRIRLETDWIVDLARARLAMKEVNFLYIILSRGEE